MEIHGRAQAVAIINTPAARPATIGTVKLRFRLPRDVLRQANSGPTPVKTSSSNPTGIITRLKNGGPTVTFVPCTHSDRIGNSVPQRTVKHATRKITLLNRKLDSRDTNDSNRCSDCRWLVFFKKKNRHTANVSPRKIRNHVPIEDCANACTELTTPERVRKVPRMASMKVAKISHMFHFFIMPRFSCIITECRNAVPVSNGSSEAFSTGSHPQYPPHPRTEYAQCMPRKTPTVRNPHVTIVQRRVMWIHFLTGLHIARAPSAQANGTLNPT